MFNNFTEFTLWDLADSSLKIRDKDTNQMEYVGVERGQTERYFITVSRILKDLFNTVEQLYDMSYFVNITDSEIADLIKKNDLSVFSGEAHEFLIRILRNCFRMWSMRGSIKFLQYVTEDLFGFTLVSVSNSGDDIIFKFYDPLQPEPSTFFEPTKPVNNIFYAQAFVILSAEIIVGGAVEYRKKAYEQFIKDHFFELTINYVY